MRFGSMRLSIALASVFLLAGGLPNAKSEEQTPEIRLMAMTEIKAVGGGHFVTTAQINNRSVQVLVDTGASAVALSYEDADTVGLRPASLDFSIPVSTANGMTKAAPVTLKKVEIDGVRVSDVAGVVLPRGAMRGSLLGMSFLSKLSSFKVEDGVLKLKN
jgi:aspartyl protease family protein